MEALSNVACICFVGVAYQSNYYETLAPLVDVREQAATVVVKVEPNVEVSYILTLNALHLSVSDCVGQGFICPLIALQSLIF